MVSVETPEGMPSPDRGGGNALLGASLLAIVVLFAFLLWSGWKNCWGPAV